MNALDNAAVKVGKMKKSDLKPKTHHFFYAVVWLAGWLAPPLAVAIRFGIGKDFFINVLCTICGYFPGHFHKLIPISLASQYCQTIRNNQNAARTPKWAVKYGLVKVKDKRGGKHQWAGRYDGQSLSPPCPTLHCDDRSHDPPRPTERLPDSSRNDYADASTSSLPSSANGEWDGHGPEPPKSDRRNNGGSGKLDRGSFWQPWDAEVDPDEVEGAPQPSASASTSGGGGGGRTGDPFENEEFYSSNNDQTGGDYGARAPAKKSNKKGIKGLMGNRDRYESNPGNGSAGTGDRFSKMNSARGGRSSGGDGYEDDFERELNQAKKASLAESGGGAAAGGGARAQQYDSFEREVPEQATRAKNAEPEEVAGGTRQGTRADDDLFNHTF